LRRRPALGRRYQVRGHGDAQLGRREGFGAGAAVDVFTVQRLAGHAVTTARYDRRGEGERRRAAAQLRIPVSS